MVCETVLSCEEELAEIVRTIGSGTGRDVDQEDDMPNLVEELKQEHEEIVRTFEEVKNCGIVSSEGQELLLAVKNKLLNHLKKEDERLYIILELAAEKDVQLRQTLDLFANDTERITLQVIEFYEKYSRGGTGFTFAEDFGRLCAALTSRMSKEENILFKKYDKMRG